MAEPHRLTFPASPATDAMVEWPRTRGSLFVRVVMGPMTRVLNPLIRRIAGRGHMNMAAQIHHLGRRTGRLYVTPASARVYDDTAWIPLTFGTQSDWCQNVRAAGGCTIRWRGNDYRAANPVLFDRSTALAATGRAFKPQERVMLRMIGIHHFIRMDATPA